MAEERSNQSLLIAASAARTTAQSFAKQFTPYHRGVTVVVNISAVADTPSVTFKIQGHEPNTDQWYDILASAAKTATGQFTLTVHPGASASANVSVGAPLPAEWRVVTTVGDADSATYSIGANLHA